MKPVALDDWKRPQVRPCNETLLKMMEETRGTANVSLQVELLWEAKSQPIVAHDSITTPVEKTTHPMHCDLEKDRWREDVKNLADGQFHAK